MAADVPRLTRPQLASIAIWVEGGMIVVGCFIAWLIGVPIWSQLNASWITVALGFAAAIPPLIIVIAIAESDTRFGEMSRRDFAPVIEMFRNATIFDLFYVSALAGLGEEALFRGALQVGIEPYIGVAFALVTASLIFGLAHAMSKSYFTFATLIGLYFGGLLLWTGSLLVPMIAHATYDFAALLYGTRFSKRLKSTSPSMKSAVPHPDLDATPPQ